MEVARSLAREGLRVAVAAYTHKAVGVLRSALGKGVGARGVEARTLHSIAYAPKGDSAAEKAAARWAAMDEPAQLELLGRADVQDEDDAIGLLVGEIEFERRETSKVEYDVVLVDEGSMLTRENVDALAAALDPPEVEDSGRVAVFGDPAQLPPVEGASALDALVAEPRTEHVHLPKVHRQAQGGEVLAAAIKARGGTLRAELQSFGPAVVATSKLVVCWSNKVRKRVHRAVRRFEGRGPLPEKGETLTAYLPTRKHMDKLGLLKGTDVRLTAPPRPAWIASDRRDPEPVLLMRGEIVDTGATVDFAAYPSGFDAVDNKDVEHKPVFPKRRKSDDLVDADGERIGPAPSVSWMDFAACRTVYKAQGSEAEEVVIVYDFAWMRAKKPDLFKRAMYTAVTRASDRLHFMRPPPPSPRGVTVAKAVRTTLGDPPKSAMPKARLEARRRAEAEALAEAKKRLGAVEETP